MEYVSLKKYFTLTENLKIRNFIISFVHFEVCAPNFIKAGTKDF